MAAEVKPPSEKAIPASDKKRAILEACYSEDRVGLTSLASSKGGLLEDELRATAWPLLLQCPTEKDETSRVQSWKDKTPHQDEEQVQKDVDRAFVHYPINESTKSIDHRRVELSSLIVKILRLNPMLHYFQGYHDIAQVFLLVLGEESAFPVLERVSLLRIRDYMLPTIGPAEQQMQLITVILRAADPELAMHLSNTRSFFALGALLTLYAYLIEDYSIITRLYDFILAHDPIITIYMIVAHILERRTELLEEDDEDMLHHHLQHLPPKVDYQALIERTLQVYGNYPPEKLPGRAWSRISRYSVLKTSKSIAQQADLNAARELFALQEAELRRQEMMRKMYTRAVQHGQQHRKRYMTAASTLLVVGIAYWARKSGSEKVLWSMLSKVQSVWSL